MNMKNITVLTLMSLIMISCGGLKTGIGYYGVMCGDDKITLDGDTFGIQEEILDGTLIVWSYPEWNPPCYLIKKADTGYYYVQTEGNKISSIANTFDMVGIDDEKIYNIKNKTEFPLSCDMSNLCYLGDWNGLYVFTNQDSICFSDGKYLKLQDDAYCYDIASEFGVTLINGARKLAVPFETLHKFQSGKTAEDKSIVRLEKDYYIQPSHECESDQLGFSVNIDIPKGNSDSDNAIRNWMLGAIKDDAFSLLGYEKDFPVGKCSTVNEMQTSLEKYGNIWEKLCRNGYQYGDTLDVNLNCLVQVRKVVDCCDYATYHYFASTYGGGLHEMIRSYYITYDKNRHLILSASNTVKPSMTKQFISEVLDSLKQQYDEKQVEHVPWNEFTQYIFSFHQPDIDIDTLQEELKPLIVHQYSCDEWSGWGDLENEEFTESHFPLPHLALIPEGIVVTYHPYQIDCFAAGEYHALVSYSKVNSCLQYDYHEIPELLPKLEQFVVR